MSFYDSNGNLVGVGGVPAPTGGRGRGGRPGALPQGTHYVEGDVQQLNDSSVLYSLRSAPVVVSNSAMAVRGYLDPNPVTNRFAAIDILCLYSRALFSRRWLETIGGTGAFIFGALFLINFTTATILAVSGRLDPVALEDPTNPNQVAMWAGSNVAAPFLQMGGGAALEVVDRGGRNNAVLVRYMNGSPNGQTVRDRGAGSQYPVTDVSYPGEPQR